MVWGKEKTPEAVMASHALAPTHRVFPPRSHPGMAQSAKPWETRMPRGKLGLGVGLGSRRGEKRGAVEKQGLSPGWG